MRGWVAAALLAAGWAATCVEARRRWEQDRKALVAAREGLALGYSMWRSGVLPQPSGQRIVTASQMVGAALEARESRGFRGSFQ